MFEFSLKQILIESAMMCDGLVKGWIHESDLFKYRSPSIIALLFDGSFLDSMHVNDERSRVHFQTGNNNWRKNEPSIDVQSYMVCTLYIIVKLSKVIIL